MFDLACKRPFQNWSKTIGNTSLLGSWASSRRGRLHLPSWPPCMIWHPQLAKTAVLLHMVAAAACQHTRSQPLDICCCPHRANLPPARAPPQVWGPCKADRQYYTFRSVALGTPPKTADLQLRSCFYKSEWPSTANHYVYTHYGNAAEVSRRSETKLVCYLCMPVPLLNGRWTGFSYTAGAAWFPEGQLLGPPDSLWANCWGRLVSGGATQGWISAATNMGPID